MQDFVSGYKNTWFCRKEQKTLTGAQHRTVNVSFCLLPTENVNLNNGDRALTRTVRDFTIPALYQLVNGVAITTMSRKIVPKAKGVDICSYSFDYFIIRSDLGCCMRATNLNKGHNVEIFSLHPACSDGDHYLADRYRHFYIIKGNYFRRLRNLTTDENSAVYTLHPKCRGGDHYLSAWVDFYIIYQKRGVYRLTKSLNTDIGGVEYSLPPDCRNGLYYFGVNDYYFFVTQNEWGVHFVESTNFKKNEISAIWSFHPSVLNFLPGGVSITMGPSFGEWTCIKTISNDSQTPIQWQKKITKKIGYEKEKMSSIEHNWKVSITGSVETGAVSSLIAKIQFSMTAEYGGASIKTNTARWTEATENEETLSATLEPYQKIYVWQYQLSLGTDPVLHCRDIKITQTSDPPTDIPIFPSKKSQ
ncbi:uncharacterized protein RB166_016153 [Leptodactylus fuscus]